MGSKRQSGLAGALCALISAITFAGFPAVGAAASGVVKDAPPTFSVTHIHYVYAPTGTSSYGLTTVSFHLASKGAHSVSAWFNTDHPTADQIYQCTSSAAAWTCTAPSISAEQDVGAASTLHVRVEGTDVLGEKVTRHRHEPAVATSQPRQSSSGGLPFTGANIFAELVAAALLAACGTLLLAIGRRRTHRHPLRLG